MSQINKAPPFLELSKSTIENLDASDLDIENVLSIWTGLTKCSNFISNGKRLENMSWRIVNRNLVYSNQLTSVSTENNNVKVGMNEISIPNLKPKNKLHDSDFLGLLSIVADQGIFQRPQLTKRKSSNKSLSSKNKSNESLTRPPIFRNSSSKSLKKSFYHQKKKSSNDLSSLNQPPASHQPAPPLVKLESDTDLFEQPHPRLAFGVVDSKVVDNETPILARSDTSTSIVRGFDPNRKPSKPPPQQLQQQQQQKSLFGSQQSPKLQKSNSLFANSQNSISQAKSPLSKDSTESIKNDFEKPVSLFQSDNSNVQEKSNRGKSLFDQVGISPELKRSIPSKNKRNNVLNNLGMTSLSNDRTDSKDKKMFFIESSPSPTESVTVKFNTESLRIDDPQKSSIQQSRSKSSLFSGQSSNSSRSSSTSNPRVHNNNINNNNNTQAKKESRENSRKRKSVSLFADNSRNIEFDSDSDSISDESDWSSVSESDDEEYDNKLKQEWENLAFRRKDEMAISKPQIKRSLLSGLFLNELDHSNPHHHHHLHHHQHHQHHHIPHAQPKSGTITPAESDLSSSISSQLQIKHRHSAASDALELTSAAAPSVISTSHINVSGLVNNEEPYSEKHTDLKAKLSEHTDPNPSSSFSNLISKSALNLSNYFAHHRKNSFSSIASDRTRLKFKHESNAPPTASTILPTALSTHMFLPNAHQKAKSKLAAVIESSSNTKTFEDSTDGEEDIDLNMIHQSINEIDKNPIKSPTLPIPKKPIEVKNIEIPENEFQIAGKLSPKTTRRQMLATELSDSLRKSILWDRKHSYPTNGIKAEELAKRKKKKKKTKEDEKKQNNKSNSNNNDNNNNNEMHKISSREDTNNTTTTVTSEDIEDSSTEKFIREIKNNKWSDDEDNFYTRGW